MGRKAALVTTWGGTVPGRERQALDTFMDYLTLLGKQAADGKTDEPEAYFNYDGSGGMGIVRGDSTTLMELWESEEMRDVLSKAQLTVQDLHTQMFAAGETVQEMIATYTKAAEGFGYM